MRRAENTIKREREKKKEMGGAVKNKETQGNMTKQAITRTEKGCGYQSCRTVTCSVAGLRVSPSC